MTAALLLSIMGMLLLSLTTQRTAAAIFPRSFSRRRRLVLRATGWIMVMAAFIPLFAETGWSVALVVLTAYLSVAGLLAVAVNTIIAPP